MKSFLMIVLSFNKYAMKKNHFTSPVRMGREILL